MTNVLPQINPAGRYSVKQTAAILGISKSTLDRKVSKGYIRYGRRVDNGRRFFKGIEIIRYWNSVV